MRIKSYLDFIKEEFVISSGVEIKSILDGQHRVIKALQNDEMVKVRVLDLDVAPENFRLVFK